MEYILNKINLDMAFTDIKSIYSISSKSKNFIKWRKQNGYGAGKKSIISVKAMQTGAQNYDGVRIGPPPDLPSLLLHNRIVYLGMPLVPAVTELIVAEFLYLQYENSEKPVFM